MIVSVLRGALPPTYLRSGGSWICTVAPADAYFSRPIDALRVFPCEPSEELEERYVQARVAYLREHTGGI